HLETCARCQSMVAAIARADASGQVPSRERTWMPWFTRLVAPASVVIVAVAAAISMHREPRPQTVAMRSRAPIANQMAETATAGAAPGPRIEKAAPAVRAEAASSDRAAPPQVIGLAAGANLAAKEMAATGSLEVRSRDHAATWTIGPHGAIAKLNG